jgi:hypothetical protein
MVCVFRNGTLLDVCRDHFPATRSDKETCWLVPADDVPVSGTIELPGKAIRVEGAVRFDPDTALGDLLANRSAFTSEDLAALVTSELAGLLGLLGQQNPQELVDLDDQSRERLRAKLSLLLQRHGLRCTSLESFRPVSAAEQATPAAQARLQPEEQAATASATPTPPAAPSASGGASAEATAASQRMERELAEAVGRVRTQTDWNAFVDELEDAGFEADEAAADDVARMGQKLVDGGLTAGQVAAGIKQMAEQAARRAEIPRADLRRWTGLALRLRVTDESPEPAAQEQPGKTTLAAGLPARLPVTRRPSTWWMLRYRSVDKRLRDFLQETTRMTKAALSQHRAGLRDVHQAAKIRELDERLSLVGDLLATTPTLTPASRKLRPDRQRVKELVRSVEGAVTAAEMVQAQSRGALASQPGGAAWEEAATQTRLALDSLIEHLRARRAVHGSGACRD